MDFSRCKKIWPQESTRPVQPAGTRDVALYSETTAGPVKVSPAPSVSRAIRRAFCIRPLKTQRRVAACSVLDLRRARGILASSGLSVIPVARVAQNRRPGAIAKKHTGIPIGPIGDCAQFLRPNNENGVIDVSGDKLLRDFQSIEETGTRRRNVKARGVNRSDLLLDVTGCRRKHMVRGGSSHNDQVDLFWGHLSLLHRR